eukprot:349990-Chlamydomonas_euryale.AAC.6
MLGRGRVRIKVLSGMPVHTPPGALECRCHAVQVTELTDRKHFDAVLAEAAAADELIVVDYFTTWCGPCKLIAPKVWAPRVFGALRMPVPRARGASFP